MKIMTLHNGPRWARRQERYIREAELTTLEIAMRDFDLGLTQALRGCKRLLKISRVVREIDNEVHAIRRCGFHSKAASGIVPDATVT